MKILRRLLWFYIDRQLAQIRAALDVIAAELSDRMTEWYGCPPIYDLDGNLLEPPD